jgi:hypothetical protein
MSKKSKTKPKKDNMQEDNSPKEFREVDASTPANGMATIGMASDILPPPLASEQVSSEALKISGYVVLSPVTNKKRYEPGDVFDVSELTEKQINRLIEGGIIKAIEE